MRQKPRPNLCRVRIILSASPSVSLAALAAPAVVDAEEAPVAARPEAGVAADALAADAAAPAVVVGRVVASGPQAAFVAAVAFAAYAGRQLSADPRAGGLALAVVQRAAAPGPAVDAGSRALADAAARVADCHSAEEWLAAPTVADRCVNCWTAD